MKHITHILTFLLLLTSPIFSQFGGGPSTTSELTFDHTTIKPGQTFTAALKLTHPPHFHSYYKNDGIGISIIPTVNWTLPEGFVASELIYPTPKPFQFSGMTAYGYEGSNYFLTKITVPAELKKGQEITIKADANWQICDDKSCQPPESKTFSHKFTPTDESTLNPVYKKNLANYSTKKIPTEILPESWNPTAKEENGTITLTLSSKLPTDAFFYEYNKQIDAQKDRKTIVTESTTTFTGFRNTGNKFADAPPVTDRLQGIIYLPTKLGSLKNQSFWIDIPFGDSSNTTTSTSTETKTTDEDEKPLGVALTFALLLLGGLILNLMPCVFPVIGLKIMSFVQQAGEDTKKIKLHGIAFTVGVLLSFLALAAFLYPIKGETTLGAQLQNPIVVFIVMIIMLLLALSMAGVFEIGAKATSIGGNLQQKDGLSGSFFSGVLAVVVATPCSAPFLGPAIGAAWKFDGLLFTLALLTMGIGLAIPYITLSFFPSLVNKLPRPGAWMESFKQGMSFLLFATVGYLLWVYLGQVGEEGQKGLFIMLGLTSISIAAWIYGRWNTPIKTKKIRIIAGLFTIAFLVAGLTIAKPDPVQEKSAVAKFEWEKWSPEKVQEYLDAGTPVYVDFTAKWCLTCQSNKATAYTDEVRQMFYDKKIVTLKADMTKPHPTATKEIHALGRSAIPVNALYIPNNKTTPYITSEILTPGYLKDFIEQRLKTETEEQQTNN